MVRWLEVIMIIFSIGYLIYSIVYRNKVTFYFRGVELVVGREEEYFKAQLYFSIFNSLIIMGIAITFLIIKPEFPYIVLVPMIFHIINIIAKINIREKGYAK